MVCENIFPFASITYNTTVFVLFESSIGTSYSPAPLFELSYTLDPFTSTRIEYVSSKDTFAVTSVEFTYSSDGNVTLTPDGYVGTSSVSTCSAPVTDDDDEGTIPTVICFTVSGISTSKYCSVTVSFAITSELSKFDTLIFTFPTVSSVHSATSLLSLK